MSVKEFQQQTDENAMRFINNYQLGSLSTINQDNQCEKKEGHEGRHKMYTIITHKCRGESCFFCQPRCKHFKLLLGIWTQKGERNEQE